MRESVFKCVRGGGGGVFMGYLSCCCLGLLVVVVVCLLLLFLFLLFLICLCFGGRGLICFNTFILIVYIGTHKIVFSLLLGTKTTT